MPSLTECFKRFGVHPIEQTKIRRIARAYREDGVKAVEAQNKAVLDYVKALEEEGGQIINQIKGRFTVEKVAKEPKVISEEAKTVQPKEVPREVPPVTKEAPKNVREPYLLTQEEYKKQAIDDGSWDEKEKAHWLYKKAQTASPGLKDKWDAEIFQAIDKDFSDTHKKIVEQAISEGKEVPRNVVDEYTDLQPSAIQKTGEGEELLKSEPSKSTILEGDVKSLKWSDLPETVQKNIPEELTDLRTEPYFGTQVIKGEKKQTYGDAMVTHSYDAKTGQELNDWELGKIRSKIEDERQYEEQRAKIAVLPDVEGKKIEPAKEGKVETPKEQKKYLIDAIDEAIKQAPEEYVKPVTINIPDSEAVKPIMEKTPHVIIEVPGDGIFRVINSKQALEGFKKAVESRFPATAEKLGPEKTRMASEKPSGRRISPEKESAYEYITEYGPKRVVEADYAVEKNALVGEGWFSNGQYMVKGEPPVMFGKKVEKKPLTKETIKQVTPSLKGMSPATHAAEFHVMDSPINEGIAISDKGAAYFNPALMDVIRKYHPDATLYIKDDTSPMVFAKDKEVVAILMPMRGDPAGGLIDKYFADQGINVPWEKPIETKINYDALFQTFKNQTPNQATDYFEVEGHKIYRVEEVELPKEMGGTGLGWTDDASGNIYLRKDLNRQGFERAIEHELRHHKEKDWEETVKLADMIEPSPETKPTVPIKEKSIDEIIEEDYQKMKTGTEDRIKQNIMDKAKRELDAGRITQEKYDELAKKYGLIKQTPEGVIGEVASREVESTGRAAKQSYEMAHVGKKPHEMTKAEYVQGAHDLYGKGTKESDQSVEKFHKQHIAVALTSGDLTPGEYARLHEKDYGKIEEFAPELQSSAKGKEGVAKGEEGKIDIEFGKKIGGSKRDLWKESGLSLEDVKDMTLQERETYTKKAHVWPIANYEKFVEDGMTPGMAMLVKKIKDSISIQPEIPRTAQTDPKLREEGFKRYIELVSAIREKLPTVRTIEDIKKLRNEIFPITRQGEWSYDSFKYTDQANKDIMLLGGKSVSDAFQPRKYDLSRAEQKAEKTGFPAKQEAWQKQYDIRSNVAGEKVYRQGKDVVLDKDDWFVTKKGGHYILQDGLSSREEAEAWAKDQAKSKGEHLTRPFRENIERTGPDYRKGKNKTGDEILSEFGFRGGEFGNWTNQADRQQALNEAYDALMDLADTLKVPPKALSLNGELGIAFGARGGGSAAAHYEPGRVVINLTKTRGAGSLAHEWAHAVDDYFGRMVHKGLPGKYVSHGPSTQGEARKELLDAWGDVMKSISDRVADKEANVAMEEKGVKKMTSYLNSWLRPVDAYLKENPKADTDDVRTLLSMLYGEKPNQWNGEKIGPQEVAARLRLELIKSGYKMSTDDARKIGNNAWHLEKAQVNLAKAEAGDLVRTEKTDFLKNALAKGKGKSDNYWQRKHELFARAFESFVEDMIEEGGNKSDYLVHSTHESPTSPWGAIYPQGRDREAINEAFRKWVRTLKTKEEGKTIILYSRASEKRKGGFNEPETKPIGPTRLAKNLQADLEVSWGKKFPESAIIEVNLPKNGKTLRELGRVFGKQVVFVEGEPLSARNGVTIVESPGIIYINAKAEAPHLVTLGHELIHTLKIDEPDLYQKLLDTTEGLIQNFHVFQKLLDDSSIASGIKSEKGEAAKEELYAEFTGEQFLNTTFWKKLHGQDPTLFKRAIKIVKDLIDRAVDWLKGQISIKNTFFKDIRKVQDNLANIMKEYAKKADAKRVEGGLNPYAAIPLILPFLMNDDEKKRKGVKDQGGEYQQPSYLPPGLGR